MDQPSPPPTLRSDYEPPSYLIEEVDLHVDLGEVETLVRSTLTLRRNPQARPAQDLFLDGEGLEVRRLELDGRALDAGKYTLEEKGLRLHGVPERFTLTSEVVLHPERNTALEGLYRSGGMFCTQCEAEGFRRITFFLDRPDVLARFTTTLVADRESAPILLSNGNPDGRGDLDGGRHWARWRDPHPKPSYLFALVAGRLSLLEEPYVTAGGRRVSLRVYVEPRNADRCTHAMRSLVHAMRWDEDVYGREYDLDVYSIVAVDHFNMGAMENKGLNIFNSRYVLASPDTATDDDYAAIEGVVAHEYFHNWTGNRVTCRDWFQLSLKEGLTVFRDQEFSADRASRAVRRIGDVQVLRTHQFAEDAGPMAHPVRPDSYIEINNFYTTTVYNKGAEVVRMMHTLLGPEDFRAGTDLYFERHDGQAVTCDDFVRAMEDASGVDLAQFRLWYAQAGTPVLRVGRTWDAATRTFTLDVEQECPPTPGQPAKLPMHIPLATALLGPDGRELSLRLDGEEAAHDGGTRILELRRERESFRFVDVPVEPVPSLLRGFSAPVRLEGAWSEADLAFLAAHDGDPFVRWEAGQQLALRRMLEMVEARRRGEPLHLPDDILHAFRRTLSSPDLDDAFVARVLVLPGESWVGDQMKEVDVEGIHAVRGFLRARLAAACREQLLERRASIGRESAVSFDDPAVVGGRALANVALAYLSRLEDPAIDALAYAQFTESSNMTDTMAALSILTERDCPERGRALEEFYRRWHGDGLVLDKWFSVQAMSQRPDTLAEVRRLTGHEAFDVGNPNRVRALVGAFCSGNQVRFHEASGEGYRFLVEQVVRLDPLNPQIAARLAGALTRWRRFDEERRAHQREALERLAAQPGLSRDTGEVVARSLA